MLRTPTSPEEEWKYAEPILAWHGWRSPIDLGLLAVSLGLAGVLLCVAILHAGSHHMVGFGLFL
jgi:hypothetical protein